MNYRYRLKPCSYWSDSCLTNKSIRIFDIGKWIIDIDKWITDIGNWIVDIGKFIQFIDICYLFIDIGKWIIDIDKWELNTKRACHTSHRNSMTGKDLVNELCPIRLSIWLAIGLFAEFAQGFATRLKFQSQTRPSITLNLRTLIYSRQWRI